MNFLIRPAEAKDIEDLKELAGHFHLCSLRPDEQSLKQKIETSQKSFKEILPRERRNFLFVLEDLLQNKVIGTSQIFSTYGTPFRPYYYYIIEKEHLRLEKETNPATHLGGLVLHPDYRSRGEKLGAQISLIRFLFISSFPDFFENRLEVCLTAFLKEDNESDFWEGVGKSYLPLNYKKASELYQKNPNKFYSHFKPDLKIPLNQLPPSALEALGGVHEKTKPVEKALSQLGFDKIKKYHILDGGFSMEVYKKKLPLIQKVKKVFLKKRESSYKENYLWGQGSQQAFKGGLIQGTLKEPELFVKDFPPLFESNEPVMVSLLH